MGYYTVYQIIESKNISEEALTEAILSNTNLDSGQVYDLLNLGLEATWYDYAEDMAKITGQLPGVFITMEGDGEGRDDSWRAYFQDGKMQYAMAEIVFPPFDPALLAEPQREV